MVEPNQPDLATRLLTQGIARQHRVDLPRSARRRAIPARSARPDDITISAVEGGVWLDVAGKAGIHFSLDQWAQLTAESVALLLELAGDAGSSSGDPPGDMHI